MSDSPRVGTSVEEKYALAVTFEFDRTFAIEFPNDAWASDFSKHIDGNRYHRKKKTNMRAEWKSVHLTLPLEVMKVEVKKMERPDTPDLEYSPDLVLFFVFDKEESAQKWCQNTKLWKEDESDPVKSYMRMVWTRDQFDKSLRPQSSNEGQGQVSGQASVPDNGPKNARERSREDKDHQRKTQWKQGN